MFYFKQFEYIEEKLKMSQYFFVSLKKNKPAQGSFLLRALSLLFIIRFLYTFLDK